MADDAKPVKLTAKEVEVLRRIGRFPVPLSMQDEKALIRLKHKDLAWRDDLYPWDWYLTEAGRTHPAVAAA